MCKQGKYWTQLLLIWFWSIHIDCTLYANEKDARLGRLKIALLEGVLFVFIVSAKQKNKNLKLATKKRKQINR